MPTEDEIYEIVKDIWTCPKCNVWNLQYFDTNAFEFAKCNSCGFYESRPKFRIRHP